MSRVDGSGRIPHRPGSQTPKADQKKKDGASFDDFLEKKDEESEDEKKKLGKRIFPGGPFGPTGIRSPGQTGRGPVGAATEGADGQSGAGGGGAVEFDESESANAAKADEKRREKTRETEPTQGPGKAEGRANVDAVRSAEKASDVQVSRELMQKMVESVRVGQNRAGATEVQMDLKATVFEGMSLKVSNGPKGLITVMTVEQYSAKQAIESQMSELVARLEAQGMEVAEVRVEVRDAQTGPGGEAAQQDASGDPSAGEESAFGTEPGGVDGTAGPQDRGTTRPIDTPRPKKDRDSSTDYTL